jgi:hypothetical protein
MHAYKAPEGSTEMKLYIAVLDEVPDFIVPTLVAHNVLWAIDEFINDPEYLDWKKNSFKKCVVRVSQKEFDKISQLPKVSLGHENKTLGGRKCCAVVCPSQEVPNVLKFSKLWSPKKVILGDNESLDIIYGDYRFSIEISKIENDQLPEFDLMLYKGEESVQMAVNCWGEHLTHAKPVSDDLQHIRLSHQIVIPFGDREQQ